MNTTVLARPGDLAVPVTLRLPRHSPLPTCFPLVSDPSVTAIDWTQVARDTLDECRYSLVDCAVIGVEARRYAKKYDISPESAVEEVVCDGSWL